MAVKSFRFFWNTHKWTGIVLATIFFITACSGFLLSIKKRSDWIQPPTLQGRPGVLAEFISIEQAVQAVLDQDHADFARSGDIDRIDVRPDERVYKVRSKRGYAEMQVCAITGEVLNVGWRPSDLFEDIHDGSFFGAFVHDWLMPLIPFGLLLLIVSGFWLWLEPKVRRRRRKARRARVASGDRAV